MDKVQKNAFTDYRNWWYSMCGCVHQGDDTASCLNVYEVERHARIIPVNQELSWNIPVLSYTLEEV
jgi:hypothetical protein